MNLTEKSILKEVKRLRKTGKLPNHLTITHLKTCIRNQGYKIYTYSERSDLLEKLHLMEKSRIFSIITVSENNLRIVFHADCRSESELILLLAHELGHILLKHYNERRFLLPDLQEYEANTFAALLLSPPKNQLCTHVLVSASVLLFCICLIAFYPPYNALTSASVKTESETEKISKTVAFKEAAAPLISTVQPTAAKHTFVSESIQAQPDCQILSQAQITASPKTETAVRTETETAVTEEIQVAEPKEPKQTLSNTTEGIEEVIITKTGEKYHKSICGHIKNRENLRTIPRQQAENEGYTACADCF